MMPHEQMPDPHQPQPVYFVSMGRPHCGTGGADNNIIHVYRVQPNGSPSEQLARPAPNSQNRHHLVRMLSSPAPPPVLPSPFLTQVFRAHLTNPSSPQNPIPHHCSLSVHPTPSGPAIKKTGRRMTRVALNQRPVVQYCPEA
jgi:hypothetical protein